MKLYHGSNLVITHVNLNKCRPFKDFGRGFYLTEIPEQAEKMALRVSRIYGGEPVVNEYELDDDFRKSGDLIVKDFGCETSAEWAVFVMNNRDIYYKDHNSTECNLDNKYDIVIGPVANDAMAMLFRQYQNSLISFDMLVSGMAFRKVTNQYSFHTEKAVSLLRKVKTL